MDREPHNFLLPCDPDEARKCLYGIVDDCSDGEVWHYYEHEPSEQTENPLPPKPSNPPTENDKQNSS